jgi:hypothetical protein
MLLSRLKITIYDSCYKLWQISIRRTTSWWAKGQFALILGLPTWRIRNHKWGTDCVPIYESTSKSKWTFFCSLSCSLVRWFNLFAWMWNLSPVFITRQSPAQSVSFTGFSIFHYRCILFRTWFEQPQSTLFTTRRSACLLKLPRFIPTLRRNSRKFPSRCCLIDISNPTVSTKGRF